MEKAAKNLQVLVTGVNRGLGRQLAFQLLQKLPDSKFLFTSRKSIEQSKQLSQQFSTKLNNNSFQIKSLDLTSKQSIQNFVKQVNQQKWNFDAIVNNAAMGYDLGDKVPDPKWAKDLLFSNVIGTITMTNMLLPLLKQNGRIINISSKLGALKYNSQPVISQFSDPSLQEQQIFTAVQQYIALCEQGDVGKWFKSVYGTSKMLLNSWSRFVLKRKLKPGQVSIAMSPGHCQTDMGGKGAKHSAQSGAQTIFDCIFMENPSFDIFYHRGNAYDYESCGPDVDSATLSNNSK